MPIIATIMAALSRLFASRIGHWVAATLVFLGLSVGSQKYLVEPLLARIQSVAGELGDAAQWFAFFRVDQAITVVLSAYTVRAGMAATRVWLKRRAA